MNRLKSWLKKKLCAHEFKEAKSLGITEEHTSGFKVYHEIYTLECVLCGHIMLVRNKDDADYVLKESEAFHSGNDFI
ncbi:hypothetical protein ABE073_05160 [Lederbergia citrisecunda]|uniref:hypothetical protein n=1 Tax=Lederbergia citrisecunda TaxID=2833583 RepID=UPI003D29D62E